MLRILLIHSLFSICFLISFPCVTFAECTDCKKLKTANFIGIKGIKEYVNRKNDVLIISNEKKAKKRGFSKFKKCANLKFMATKAISKCSPVFAIIQDNTYFCPSSLKPFKSESKARAGGYVAYTSCGTSTPTPTPTATPQVTPLPLPLTFTMESGDRFTSLDSISIAKLPNGNYRSYTGKSSSSTNGDTLRFADSADGLTFTSKTPIAGVTPENTETFANPSFTANSDGSFMMIYEEIKHIGSAGLDIFNLMRIVSNDGINFSYNPSFIVIPGGSVLSSHFSPSLLKINDSTLRMYYETTQDFKTLTSSDNGANWSEAVDAPILGRGESYAPFPSEPSVILHSSGKYLMFFSSIPNLDTSRLSIFLAESSDGITFHIYNQPLFSATSDVSYTDPTAIILADGSIRLYFIVRTFANDASTTVVKSAISSGAIN